MKIYQFDIDKKIEKEKKSILLLGEFEVFHKGHLSLFKKALELKNKNYEIGILIIEKKDKKPYLQLISNRILNLKYIGFDFVIKTNFDEKFKKIEGIKFIEYLKYNFNVCNFIVGSDFRFGKDRKYEAKDIEKKSNVKTFILDLFEIDNQKVSSSLIKNEIINDQFNIAASNLVKPLIFNISIESNLVKWSKNVLVPPTGIYLIEILINSKWVPGKLEIKSNSNINLIDVKIKNIKTKIKLIKKN